LVFEPGQRRSLKAASDVGVKKIRRVITESPRR
jgi:hypothetical protein